MLAVERKGVKIFRFIRARSVFVCSTCLSNLFHREKILQKWSLHNLCAFLVSVLYMVEASRRNLHSDKHHRFFGWVLLFRSPWCGKIFFLLILISFNFFLCMILVIIDSWVSLFLSTYVNKILMILGDVLHPRAFLGDFWFCEIEVLNSLLNLWKFAFHLS